MEYPVPSPKAKGEIKYEAETLRDNEESALGSVLPTPRNEELESYRNENHNQAQSAEKAE